MSLSTAPCAPDTCHIPFRTRQTSRPPDSLTLGTGDILQPQLSHFPSSRVHKKCRSFTFFYFFPSCRITVELSVSCLILQDLNINITYSRSPRTRSRHQVPTNNSYKTFLRKSLTEDTSVSTNSGLCSAGSNLLLRQVGRRFSAPYWIQPVTSLEKRKTQRNVRKETTSSAEHLEIMRHRDVIR